MDRFRGVRVIVDTYIIIFLEYIILMYSVFILMKAEKKLVWIDECDESSVERGGGRGGRGGIMNGRDALKKKKKIITERGKKKRVATRYL